MENENDIKKKIDEVLLKCSNIDIYSNIIKDFFTKGINKKSETLESLNILPKYNEEKLKKKFIENKNKICDFIKNKITKNLSIYHVLSCIFGSFVGDAVGAFCEFHKSSKNNYKKIFKDNPVFGQLKGQITDDSEMAMCCAFAIMDIPEKEKIDSNYLYFYYGAWSKSHPIDIGTTTRKAFINYDFKKYNPKNNNFKQIQNEIFSKNFNSVSNGFLMRKCTLIAWIYYRFYADINSAFSGVNDTAYLLEFYKKVKEFSYIDNICSHPNLETHSISAFYIIMAIAAIKQLSANNIINIIYQLCKNKYFKEQGEEEEIKNAKFIVDSIDIFKDKNFNFWDYFGRADSPHCVAKNIGWHKHSFKLTLFYLINFEYMDEKNRFKEILDEICNLGGDTDTNACIVGGVIGPLVGLNNFGEYFFKVLDVVPNNRSLFSVFIIFLYVQYLKNSNRNNGLIKNEKYFLKTILTLLYDDIEINIE